jgi:hypothetical protein
MITNPQDLPPPISGPSAIERSKNSNNINMMEAVVGCSTIIPLKIRRGWADNAIPHSDNERLALQRSADSRRNPLATATGRMMDDCAPG